METKLKNLINQNIFDKLVLEGKKSINIDEIFRLGEIIWNEAQKDIINKLDQFEKDEKILIITEDDKELLHGFDYTQEKHIKAKEKLKEFLKQ